jgi:hypothetical protein
VPPTISAIEGRAKIAAYQSFASSAPVRGRWWLACRNQPGPCITQRCAAQAKASIAATVPTRSRRPSKGFMQSL